MSKSKVNIHVVTDPKNYSASTSGGGTAVTRALATFLGILRDEGTDEELFHLRVSRQSLLDDLETIARYEYTPRDARDVMYDLPQDALSALDFSRFDAGVGRYIVMYGYHQELQTAGLAELFELAGGAYVLTPEGEKVRRLVQGE